jgi:superfamily II DNA or RNA helicase/HKD family nuclease
MRIPYVIDNQTNKLADVLNALLAEYKDRSLDISTAYFTIGGFKILKEGLKNLGNLRLLLGIEPRTGEQIGLRPDPNTILTAIRQDLESEPYTEETLRLIEDLIRFLRQNNVAVRVHEKGFLHAKCYLFYSDRPGQQFLFERFKPVLAIVGSSNLTGPGLTSNRELNIAHKVLLDEGEAEDPDAQRAVGWLSEERPSERISSTNRRLLKSEVGARAIIELERWFEQQWKDARDFKEDLVELLDASKFGQKEYTPYQVYMKALFEYFKDELDGEVMPAIKSAIDLAEFQEDAVKKARKILARYDGVMIADSVGLGKTWIGKKLLEDFAYHMRQKALVICPASLRKMWADELNNASIASSIVSQEELGQADFPVESYGDTDVILIDESHNFRNRNAQRYENLERLVSLNAGRGREGLRKKVIMLTATPINNDLLDLYNQLSIVTQGDRGYFSACGIGDLHRYFLNARRMSGSNASTLTLFNLLEEVVVRRTRPFIRRTYPDATIRGEKITFPERRLKTINYNLEKTYSGIYEQIVSGIESLFLAPYNLERYKRTGVEIDEFERGREEALVGIFKSRYLKRFESSIRAFQISIRRALEFQKTFESYILDGKILNSSDFHKALRYVEKEEEEDDATPVSRAEELDTSEEAQTALAGMQTVDPTQFDLRRLHEAVQHDIEILSEIWQQVKDIRPEQDAKLESLKNLLAGALKGKKVIVFSHYKDTAKYLFDELGREKGERFRKSIDNPVIRRMDSDTKDRTRVIQSFAPIANKKPELAGTEEEIDILISTDVLSEGQNLQDCGYLVNYDLHWNPTRMVQRAGRIDRIGTKFNILWIYNMFPDEGLERLLGLVESLTQKIQDIDKVGLLDASILGETVHPRNFNTLRRIRDEDGTVIEEEEQFTELASNEFLLMQLKSLLGAGGREMLESLPDGIHSGLARRGAKGIFFYFQAQSPEGKLHFWKYYDLIEQRIIDNRYIIANLISCDRDTPRVIADYDVFKLQEKVIENILHTFEEQQALNAIPKTIEPEQQTLATTLQGYLSHPDVDRQRTIELIYFLNRPLMKVQLKELRAYHKNFQRDGDIQALISSVEQLRNKYGKGATPLSQQKPNPGRLKREDLRLICFDFVCS